MNNFEKFKKTGVIKLTFSQGAEVIEKATGNNVKINPFDSRSIQQAALEFGDNNCGKYPSISPLEGGGFTYTTISGRIINLYPKNKGWVLDCSDWWSDSKYFRDIIIESLKEVLANNIPDPNIPEPKPQHTHEKDLSGQSFYLYEIPANNHGCRGFSILVEAITSTRGKVIEGSSCSSCWQVGHDSSDSPIPIGSEICLPINYCWVCASEEDLNFRSSRDISRNGATIITPFDVEIVD